MLLRGCGDGVALSSYETATAADGSLAVTKGDEAISLSEFMLLRGCGDGVALSNYEIAALALLARDDKEGFLRYARDDKEGLLRYARDDNQRMAASR